MKNLIYCAFCKLQRKVVAKKDVNWMNVVLSFVCATGIQLSCFQELDGRIIVLFVVCLIAAQAFLRIRWRVSLPCPHCAFDPVLYKTNRPETVERVKKHLAQLKTSGKYLIRTQNPFESLPQLPPVETNKKQHISKQV